MPKRAVRRRYGPKKRRRKASKKSYKPKTVRNFMVRTMRQIAKHEIHRAAENKEVRLSEANRALYSYPITTTVAQSGFVANNIIDCSDVWDTISQGVGEGQRVGNKIKIMKYRYTGILNCFNREGSNNFGPFYVRIWVLTYKFDPNGAQVTDIWSGLANNQAGNFFDNGNATNGMQGNLLDLMLPVNTKVWTVHKCMTFKLGYQSNPNITGADGNNDFAYSRKFYIDLKKYQGGTIQYNDTSTTSFNKKLFIVYEVLNAGGIAIADTNGTGGTLDNRMLNLTSSFNFEFEDI